MCTVDRTDWVGLFATSLAVSGVGLALFFVGLGLDVHGHIVRDHGTGLDLSLTPSGLALAF